MMRTTFLLLVATMFVGCATNRRPHVVVRPLDVPGTTLPSDGVESVRHGENIKAYPLARYIDPSNRRLMHEAHTIYRVETTPKWNLVSNSGVMPPGGFSRAETTASTAPQRDELIVELNRQKAATRAVLQGTQTVSQKLTQLGESVQLTGKVAAENVVLRREIEAAQQRLNSLEAEMRRQTQPRPAPSGPNTPETADW